MVTYDEIPAYYDWLSRYVQVANWLAYRDRFASFTMHKTLSVPASAPSESAIGANPRTAGLQYVNSRLLKAARLTSEPRVLDAGCGFGGTIFHWQSQIGGSYDGFTLSRVQLRVAERESRRRGLAQSCRFHLQSYDAPLDATYDAVVAIESMIHSPDLNKTIPNLAAALRPGGVMIILDDMGNTDVERDAPTETDILRNHWGCARYPTEQDYRTALAKAQLKIVDEDDLTRQVQPREAVKLDRLEARYNRLYAALHYIPSIRIILSSYIGGLALERLYLKSFVRYRLFVARKD